MCAEMCARTCADRCAGTCADMGLGIVCACACEFAGHGCRLKLRACACTACGIVCTCVSERARGLLVFTPCTCTCESTTRCCSCTHAVWARACKSHAHKRAACRPRLPARAQVSVCAPCAAVHVRAHCDSKLLLLTDVHQHPTHAHAHTPMPQSGDVLSAHHLHGHFDHTRLQRESPLREGRETYSSLAVWSLLVDVVNGALKQYV